MATTKERNRIIADELREYAQLKDLSTSKLALRLGVSQRTLEGWMQGRPCNASTASLLRNAMRR